MGYMLYLSAILWAFNGAHFGSGTIKGLLCYVIAAVFGVGGAVIFALKDLPTPQPRDK